MSEVNYAVVLLDMIYSVQGEMEPYPLGDGYSIEMWSSEDVGICSHILLNGTLVAAGYGSLDFTRHTEHMIAVATLLYAQRDVIVALYLADLDAARPAAEAELAQVRAQGIHDPSEVKAICDAIAEDLTATSTNHTMSRTALRALVGRTFPWLQNAVYHTYVAGMMDTSLRTRGWRFPSR